MLTHDVNVAVSPETTVSGLAASSDGNVLAWSQNNGTLGVIDDQNQRHNISIEGNPVGIFIYESKLLFGDDNFGVKCVDFQCNQIWECEVPGGVSRIEKCVNFIAVIDNLGRLTTISYSGEILYSSDQFTSLINLLAFGVGVVLVQENGSVHYFDGEQSTWHRPPRGEVGESITAVGCTSADKLVIGREGYALVPGEEEALEVELWDVFEGKLLMRTEVKNRLLNSSANSTVTYLGFDDGSIHQLVSEPKNSYAISDCIIATKYPIKILETTDDWVIAGSWFYLHGINTSGEHWMIEHQGIVQYLAYCKSVKKIFFAGDDQNDFTKPEPIGVIDLSSDLVERDKSELTAWFEFAEQNAMLSADEIYSEDDKLTALMGTESAAENHLLGGDLDNILSALEESNVAEDKGPDSTEISDINLMAELMDDVKSIQRPIAHAGDDSSHQCGDDGYCIVVLDSGKSSGIKGRSVSYSWVEETGKEISNLGKFRVKLGRGNHRFELRITDDDGYSTSDSVQVEVR